MASKTISEILNELDPKARVYIELLQDQNVSLKAELAAVKGELDYLHRALWGAKQEEDLHRAIDQDIQLVPGGTVRNDLSPVSDE